MRILYFSRDYTTHDRRFLLKMLESGHDILFLRLQDGGTTYDQRPLPSGVRALPWRGIEGPLTPDACLRAMPRFVEALGDARPDLIHAGPIPSCAFMAALSGVHPLLAMSWGSDILVEAHEDPLTGWATKFTLSRADAFVVDCNAVREEIKALTSASDERFVQLPWGLELGRFPTPSRPLRTGQITVLSTRSWAFVYGVETVIDAFSLAARDEPRLRLVLVGDGPLAAQINARIAECGYANRISCPGRIPEETLNSYFAAADVYLSCAVSDGTSISLLEAMAHGLPVVVADAPGNREWVTPGRSGWLAPVGDARAFASALVRAAQLDEPERVAIGQHNRRVVEERADWDHNGQRLLAAYERLAPRHSGMPGP